MPDPTVPGRAGLSLLEALVAALILTLTLVPTIGLLGTSSAEIARVRSRLIAVNIVTSITEEMRARPPAERASFGPWPAGTLSVLQPIISAHKAQDPAVAARLDQLFGGFVCTAVVGGTPLAPTVTAEVTWIQAGARVSHTSTARMENEP